MAGANAVAGSFDSCLGLQDAGWACSIFKVAVVTGPVRPPVKSPAASIGILRTSLFVRSDHLQSFSGSH